VQQLFKNTKQTTHQSVVTAVNRMIHSLIYWFILFYRTKGSNKHVSSIEFTIVFGRKKQQQTATLLGVGPSETKTNAKKSRPRLHHHHHTDTILKHQYQSVA